MEEENKLMMTKLDISDVDDHVADVVEANRDDDDDDDDDDDGIITYTIDNLPDSDSGEEDEFDSLRVVDVEARTDWREECIKLMDLALADFNAKQGTSFEFVKFDEVLRGVTSVIHYFITFTAKDCVVTRIFQTYLWKDAGSIFKVGFCRIRPGQEPLPPSSISGTSSDDSPGLSTSSNSGTSSDGSAGLSSSSNFGNSSDGSPGLPSSSDPRTLSDETPCAK